MKKAFAFLSVSVLLACNSPLLNHVSTEDAKPNLKADESNTKCPLAFPQAGMCAELAWNGTPNSEDEATFTLRFWKSDIATSSGPYATPPHAVFVRLWMRSMNHGSSPITLEQAKDSGGQEIPGVYQGSKVFFIMPGKWEVQVQLKDGTQILEEAIENLEV